MGKQDPTLVLATEVAIRTGRLSSLTTVAGLKASMACYLVDSKRPQLWYRDSLTSNYYELDLVSKVKTNREFDSTVNSSTAGIQVDISTGDVYALQYSGYNDSDIWKARLTRYALHGAPGNVNQDVQLVSETIGTVLSMPLDL